VIGIDIGGANIKFVTGSGVFIHYCPLWRGAPFREVLSSHAAGGEAAAVVMSGELADCFGSKAEGIRFICGMVRAVFPDAIFYGTDGQFHREPVPALAAANWLAAADFLRDRYPDALLVDMGSTTTDIIPLGAFGSLLGLTDLDRMQSGLLLYTGLLRTSVAAILRSVEIGGTTTRTAAEYFACAGDAHLLLGHISPEGYTCDPPDGGGREREAASRRLARVVCADPGEIGASGVMEIARAVWEAQKEEISTLVRAVAERFGGGKVITAGIGAGLLAGELGGLNLSSVLGPGADALPALAVREVALRRAGFLP
jgi:probable H4MPT-linked C1 transfer pathway protein